MRRIIFGTLIATCAFGGVRIVQGNWLTRQGSGVHAATPVIDWSNEARRAIDAGCASAAPS